MASTQDLILKAYPEQFGPLPQDPALAAKIKISASASRPSVRLGFPDAEVRRESPLWVGMRKTKRHGSQKPVVT
jgi:hypothetical protein